MYIIQTNESLNNSMEVVDFQSISYWSKFQTFDEFKNNIFNAKDEDIEEIRYGTMIGKIKPVNSEIVNVIINDDFHLEVVLKKIDGNNKAIFTRSKYYGVKTEENFNINYSTKYKITYISPKAAKDRMNLEDCILSTVTGVIENFSPCNNVVINTKDGLEIINYRQIVEMIIDK